MKWKLQLTSLFPLAAFYSPVHQRNFLFANVYFFFYQISRISKSSLCSNWNWQCVCSLAFKKGCFLEISHYPPCQWWITLWLPLISGKCLPLRHFFLSKVLIEPMRRSTYSQYLNCPRNKGEFSWPGSWHTNKDCVTTVGGCYSLHCGRCNQPTFSHHPLLVQTSHATKTAGL